MKIIHRANQKPPTPGGMAREVTVQPMNRQQIQRRMTVLLHKMNLLPSYLSAQLMIKSAHPETPVVQMLVVTAMEITTETRATLQLSLMM